MLDTAVKMLQVISGKSTCIAGKVYMLGLQFMDEDWDRIEIKLSMDRLYLVKFLFYLETTKANLFKLISEKLHQNSSHQSPLLPHSLEIDGYAGRQLSILKTYIKSSVTSELGLPSFMSNVSIDSGVGIIVQESEGQAVTLGKDGGKKCDVNTTDNKSHCNKSTPNQVQPWMNEWHDSAKLVKLPDGVALEDCFDSSTSAGKKHFQSLPVILHHRLGDKNNKLRPARLCPHYTYNKCKQLAQCKLSHRP